MATNKPSGDGHRNGAVRKRSQLVQEGENTQVWTKRGEDGQFIQQKQDTKFKGVRKEK